jgi:hypothetical protein
MGVLREGTGLAAEFFRYGPNREHGFNIHSIILIKRLHPDLFILFLNGNLQVELSLKDIVKLRQRLEAEGRVI